MVALGAGGVEDPLPGSILKAEFSDLCEGLAGGFMVPLLENLVEETPLRVSVSQVSDLRLADSTGH